MLEIVLILYLAHTGPTVRPINVRYAEMQTCQAVAERARQRGHKAYCIRTGPIELAR